jgi:hypothetical protein
VPDAWKSVRWTTSLYDIDFNRNLGFAMEAITALDEICTPESQRALARVVDTLQKNQTDQQMLTPLLDHIKSLRCGPNKSSLIP